MSIKKKCETKYCRGKKTKPEDKFCSKCKMRHWRAAYPIKAIFAQLKGRAKRRGKEMTLTLEEFTGWVKQHNLSLKVRCGDKDEWTVDRKDVTKGYTLDNIQPMKMIDNVHKYNHVDRYHGQEELQLGGEQPF